VSLLVVDWDFFFPMPQADSHESWQLYDWGHAESMIYIKHLWPTRAATFIANGVPLPKVNDEWRTWWQRFSFDRTSVLYFHESNSAAVADEITERVDGEV